MFKNENKIIYPHVKSYKLWALVSLFIAAMPFQAQLVERVNQTQVAAEAGYSAKEFNHKLQALAAQNTKMSLKQVGTSFNQQPIYQVLLGEDKISSKLKVMIVSGQHGNEASGPLGILAFLEQVNAGQYKHVLASLDIKMLPMVNPDGWDRGTRNNKQGRNINADYVAMETPEARVVAKVLSDYAPDLLLDMHESPIYKSMLTGKQGYMTDVESQFEIANNLNAPVHIRDYADNIFLPQLIESVISQGQGAQRYQGAIVKLNQPLTEARASLTSLRNYAAFYGTLSVLLENRLDYPGWQYPTPGNLSARIAKQCLGLTSFLALTSKNKVKLMALLSLPSGDDINMVADTHYQGDPNQLFKSIPLLVLATGKQEIHQFPYLSDVKISKEYLKPKSYAIIENKKEMAQWLNYHHFRYSTVEEASQQSAIKLVLKSKLSGKEQGIGTRSKEVFMFKEDHEVLQLKQGDLLVTTSQPLGDLASLLLDARSSYGLYQNNLWPLTLHEQTFIVPLI